MYHDLLTERTSGFDVAVAQGQIRAALGSASRVKGNAIVQQWRGSRELSLGELADLLLADDEDALLDAAVETTSTYFGATRSLFAPIYLSDACQNDCGYCSFRRGNRALRRSSLEPREIVESARVLAGRGVRTVMVLSGSVASEGHLEYLSTAVNAVGEVEGIRHVEVGVGSLPVTWYRALRQAGARAHVLFQETYDRDVYCDDAVHPLGTEKRDFDGRLAAHERAAEAGFGVLGLGALFGLGDHRTETLSLIMHARWLNSRYPEVVTRVSVPRLRPAAGATIRDQPSPVSEADFIRIVCVLRMGLPDCEIVLTARERAAVRDRLFSIATTIGAQGSTSVSGYLRRPSFEEQQFTLADRRTVAAIRVELQRRGFVVW